jgi:hypothetical protein
MYNAKFPKQLRELVQDFRSSQRSNWERKDNRLRRVEDNQHVCFASDLVVVEDNQSTSYCLRDSRRIKPELNLDLRRCWRSLISSHLLSRGGGVNECSRSVLLLEV